MCCEQECQAARLDPEGSQAASSGNTLIFGRITYELMESFWPTEEALKTDPLVAQGMNNAEKIVFSRTLNTAGWNNTRR